MFTLLCSPKYYTIQSVQAYYLQRYRLRLYRFTCLGMLIKHAAVNHAMGEGR